MLCYMKKQLPDVQRLAALRSEGKTYKQIAAWVEEKTGQRVSPASVGAALSRAGKTDARARYTDHIPWVVHAEHTMHYAVRMLRMLGRRDAGLELTAEQEQRLDSWLQKLRDEHAIVAYLPDSEDGFYYIDGDWPADGIPIKRPPRGGEGRRAS